ncbi:glycosyltransferase [Wohlfahrtiimonas chitiniclastica]|uniref:glycosyltransferase n=1 Tax=Wohlfahrtiimonas chitiniclastica TaxID=400946 RepID=UPI001BCB58E2|nr:glycosyltransferase [Wohlfahrtiimonas chitiniclastica]MBS7828738.1 glycosyltransferase [Wohlfahrtiimonas chitiniclastica]
MHNIHINMNEFTNASRVLKQTQSLISSKTVESISILALGSTKLPIHEEISDNIKLYRIPLLTRNLPKNLFFQSFKYIEFFIKAIFILIKQKPAIVNAHALSVLPIAILYKILFAKKVVYDAHELETEQTSGNSVKKRFSKYLERLLIKKVDLTIVVSESIADWYMNEYNISRPTVVLNVPRKQALLPHNHFREQLNIRPDQLILLYQGGLMKGRGVHLILEAFKQRPENDIVAVFMGYGELEEEIKKASHKSNNIFFYPAVSPHIVLEYTSSADIGISLIENTCLSYYYCMPNKLFEYAMAGLPVIVSNMKDMSEVVNKNHMGIVIEDFSPNGINLAIDNLLQQDLQTLKSNAYMTACNNSWEMQENKMLSAYKTII